VRQPAPFIAAAESRTTGCCRLIVTLLLAAIVTAATGCDVGETSAISETDTDPPILVHTVRGGGDDAEIGGYLRYLAEAGCLVLESDPGAEQLTRHVVVWPPGTEPVQDLDELVGVNVPDVGMVRLGDWVSGGGGYDNPDTSEVDLPEVPAACLVGGGEFAALHAITSTTPGT
jgi:hypothetical protein